jgi:large subunit ribosomal protein L5
MDPKLKVLYKNTITPDLIKEFGYTNVHQVPELVKIKVNR